jgi:DNA-3-methyladenine glycosylase II
MKFVQVDQDQPATAEHPFAAVARAAQTHLAAVEPRFAPLIDGIGPCTLTPDGDLFPGLVRAVLAQLISTAAAKSITAKVTAAVKNRLTPAALGKLTDDQFQACGVSGPKRKTLRGVVELFAPRGTEKRLLAADDATLRRTLTALHGIGPWTVDMVEIFCLGRPDVWPVGDLGVRAAVKDQFKLRALPDAKRMTKLAAPWQPYRTVAAWYLWRSRGWVPQSEG